ncbi:MAG: hypothetical protein ACRC80_19735 [Waterburya sp.]
MIRIKSGSCDRALATRAPTALGQVCAIALGMARINWDKFD